MLKKPFGLRKARKKSKKFQTVKFMKFFSTSRSFIVFLPEMKESNLPFMSRVEESHFKRKLVVVPGMVHEYRHGYQHVLPKYVLI